jgi:hypothetical protein
VGFLIAGIARLVGALIVDEFDLQGFVVVLSVLEGLAMACAFASLALAGFPIRSTLGKAIAWTLVGLYVFLGFAGYALGSVAPLVVAGLGLVVLAVGVAFAILAGRNPAIPASLRYLPFVLYGGLILAVATPILIALLLGAVVLITVGVLFLAFAPRAASMPA